MRSDEALAAAIFVGFCAIIVLLEIGSLIFFLAKKKFPSSPFAVIVHTVFLTGVLSVLYGFYIEPYLLEVKHINIFSEKLKNTELTVVQISDLHCEKKTRCENKLPDVINRLNPDVVLFTGDAVNDSHGIEPFRKMMSKIRSVHGNYAVRGNFDHWFWINHDMLKNTGFTELDGRVVRIRKNNELFTVSGIRVTNGFRDLTFAADIPPEAYNIFMFHYPGMNKTLAGKGVDLFLSGHTHGGQVALPFYGAIVTLSQHGKKFEAGRYDINGKILYVNRGIGMEGGHIPRIRFLNRPEITVFHIKPLSETDNKKVL